MTNEQIDTQAVVDELISRLNAAVLENVVLTSRVRGLQEQVARLTSLHQEQNENISK